MIKLSRRRFLHYGGVFLATLVPDGLVADTAPPDRTYRIFMVLGREEGANEAGFKDYLSRRGMKVEYKVRVAGGDLSRMPGIVEEIRASAPDLIYTWGTPQTRGIVGPWDAPDPSGYIRDIPVVFTFVAAPLDALIVRDLKRPGANVTGTIHIAPIEAQINTILAYRPITRLGVVYNPAERNMILTVNDLRDECARRGLTLFEVAAPLYDGKPDPADIPDLMKSCKDQQAEILYIGPDTFIAFTHRKLVAETALRLGLPTFSATESIVRNEQALFSLSSSYYGIGRLTGVKAAQILVEGMAPGDIPVETLKRFSLVINIATAKALAFYPPLNLLNFAEIVGV